VVIGAIGLSIGVLVECTAGIDFYFTVPLGWSDGRREHG
jgi:hypothetical protein